MILPHKPGCYLFKDKRGNIIYVGKAKDLKKRVSSYFNRNDLDAKTANLVSSIDDTDFIVTTTEIEALILENNLIKKYQPKYNINLKDSKRYAYLKITDEKYPRLVLARKRGTDGKYFGPFVSGALRDYVLEVVRKVFSLRTCRKMPKRPCLRYHIKICDAPCAGFISQEDYAKKIKDVELVLKGKIDDLIIKLDGLMKKMSNSNRYEEAIKYREQIHALEYLSEKQKMERQKKYDEDIIGYIVRDGRVYLLLFNISKGILLNKQEFVFDYIDDFFSDFLMQYYSDNNSIKEAIIPRSVDKSLDGYLKGKKVKLKVPKRGEKKKLLNLVIKNIEINYFGNVEKLEQMQKKLKLNELPNVIECFDISHLSGTSTVGSMVQFRNGIPDKNNYRRFKIRTVEGIDDTASISEVVYRRYSRLKRESEVMPNLVIIDGGKGQLKAALNSLSRVGVKIPIISIAKRFEEIYFPGLSHAVRLDSKDKALQFIREIRDEAHRFAIKYNRLLRKKEIR